jgi:hypothetical protein
MIMEILNSLVLTLSAIKITLEIISLLRKPKPPTPLKPTADDTD